MTSDRPTLSLCMIVRNEEAYLARCLESVRGLVDEIVIVDTGSTDRTLDIARSFGARVSECAWQDDFSLARNAALEQATGDWILSLDADESIAPRDHAAIAAELRLEGVDAIIVPNRSYLASGKTIGWQAGDGGYEEGLPYAGFKEWDCLRLFRNRPWLRFRNRVHELLVSTDPRRPLAPLRGNWIIHHFGKAGDPEVLRAKAEAYLRMGIAKVAEHPRDPQAHYELGVQYAERCQHELALPCFERAQALSPRFRDAEFLIAHCLVHLKQHGKALEALGRAARTLPQLTSEIAFEEGNVHLVLGDETAAERAYRRALAHNPLYGIAATSLADVCWRQRRTAEALTCLDQLLERCPRHLEARLLRSRIRQDAGDHAGAESDLDQLGSYGRAPIMRARVLAQQRRFHEARAALEAMDRAPGVDVLAIQGAIALGLGHLADAVVHLRASLAAEPTHEAALNLSTALDASGDRDGALHAAAEALGLSPELDAAIDRFRQLCGHSLQARSAHTDSKSLTLFFHAPDGVDRDRREPSGRELSGPATGVVRLAEELAHRGHRVVVFADLQESATVGGVEYARCATLPARCVSAPPDVLIGARSSRLLGQVRLAPLQILWTGATGSRSNRERSTEGREIAEIDLWVTDDNGVNVAARDAMHDLLIWPIAHGPQTTRLADVDRAGEWETLIQTALSPEPPVVTRIAVHLSAGRAALAKRMLQAAAPPSDVPVDVWQELRALVDWRTGSVQRPSLDTLRHLTLRFPSLRRVGSMAWMREATPPTAGTAA